jgi:hypothetical protein
MADNGVAFRRPCDYDACFYIQDFMKGDSIIVKSGSDRERGIVDGADYKLMKVVYSNSDGEQKKAGLNDIILLQGPTGGWLD